LTPYFDLEYGYSLSAKAGQGAIMAWTQAECDAAEESLHQLEIGSVNAEKFPNTATKRELLEWYATAIKNLQVLIDKNCPLPSPE
jgi:hypothetical protein